MTTLSDFFRPDPLAIGSELWLRGADWEPGRPVLLANGEPWHLPWITPALAMTCPSLAEALVETAAVFRLVKEAHPGIYPPLDVVRRVIWPQWRRLGSLLLRVNYAITDAEADALLGREPNRLRVIYTAISTQYSIGRPRLGDLLEPDPR